MAEAIGPVERALRVAASLERPELGALEAAGVRRWDALAAVRRLHEAGDLRDGQWVPGARERWLAAPSPPDPGKAIDRLAQGERPREKAMAAGIDALDDADLLALILRTGGSDGVIELAQRLLNAQGGLAGLARLSVEQLAAEPGLGPAKAAELAAALAIGRRVAASVLRTRPEAGTPEAVAALVAPLMACLAHEELWVLCLDPRLRLIGDPRQVSRGDIDGTDAGPRAVLRIALTAGAAACVCVHNHPSGDPAPSASDLAATRRLVQAGRAVDLPVHDHVIIGAAGAFTSLRRTRPELFA